jgi:hypothetical protein
MNAALLIGREGSQGFPGKNLYPVLGRPMAVYPLLAALNARSIGRTFLSTDSPRIMALAREHGAEIIERPLELCTPQALGEDAFHHGYRVICERLAERGETLDALALLFCNAPTLLASTIDTAADILQADPSIDSVVTVSRYNMWSPLRARRETASGLLEPFVPFEIFGDPATLNCDRDSQGDVWFADMSLSLVRPRCMDRMHDGLLPQKWMGRRIAPLKQWGGLDVDYEWQVPQVGYWLSAHGFTPSSTPYAAAPRQGEAAGMVEPV